jgi:uncharacterized protein (TIGR03437 family)
MIEMANKRRITKVSRVFACVYTYTAIWEKAAGARMAAAPAAREYLAMTKTRTSFLSLCVLLLTAAAFSPRSLAQTVTATRVSTNPSGPWFTVDGTTFFSVMSAFWPVGSQHTLGVNSGTGYSYNTDATIQWQFQNWQWAGGGSTATSIHVIADPTVAQYTAVFNALYLFTVQTACNPAPCSSPPGELGITGIGYTPGAGGAVSSWQAPNSTQTLQVSVNPGWLFAGWQVGNNPLVTTPTSNVTLTAPMTVTAVFVPSKTVNFATNPAGLQLYADRTLMNTPQSLQWGVGTIHTVGAIDVQQDDQDKRWVFSSWSDGGAFSHTYVVGNNLNPETITANYVAAAYPFFGTSPPNLNLVVDGLTLPPPYSYIWGVGTTHQISATTPQKDAQGNTWVFQSWDDQVTTPSRTITIPVGADVNGYGLTALYTSQAKLTIASTLAGQVVTVDGSPCTTPCSVVRNAGTQVHVSAPASVPVSGASRQNFLGWSTGAGVPVAGDWIAPLNAPSTSITATYQLMNSLTVSATPSSGAKWSISPASKDGFYGSQTQVTVVVTARPGYRFSSWSGDLSGSTPSGQLTMNVPHSVVAQFRMVPRIASRGGSDGAGSAPQPGVAPGAVASIFGSALAATTAVGPASPLVRTLAGVTVHIGPRLLPLYFVSPTEINLQIPPDLAPGTQTVTVSSPDMPDFSSDFTIVRNAPGLLPVLLDGQAYAMVMHEDGTPVTAAAPARRGELLTAYGTGFGPTDHVRPEGIAIPPAPLHRILDPVTLQVGSSAITPESAFAAPGQVGVDLIQFRLDASAPSGAAIPLSVSVNGVNGNILPLPIQ